jgi:hypothetical protein
MTSDGLPAAPHSLPGFLRDLPPNEGVEGAGDLPSGGLLAVSEGGFEGEQDSGVVVAEF